MRRRMLAVLVAATCMLAQPTGVAATYYSYVTFFLNYLPPALPATALCGQAGIVDVATNYNQGLTKQAGGCATSQVVGAGLLGSEVAGYRNGAYCGDTGIYWSTVATAAWQLWSRVCSNPAGLQTFYTYGRSWAIQSGGGVVGGYVYSPGQQY